MSTPQPHLDHATKGDRTWAWVAGCWREWSDVQANWLPSAPPPADAEFFNYREWTLSRMGLKRATRRQGVAA